MMPYGWHDGAVGVVWMVLGWGMFVAAVWTLVRAFGSRDGVQRPRDAKDVLADRYAKGDIDAEEYRERLRVLEDSRRSATSR